eukprot:scaffold63810_cov16-Tisochrysis_lutea.AAC.1
MVAAGLQILVVNAGEEEVFEAAMEVGAEDIQPVEGGEDGSDGYKVLRDFMQICMQFRFSMHKTVHARARVEHALLASVFTSVPDFVSAKASLQQKGFKLAEEDSLLIAIHPYFWLPDLTALFVTAIPVQVYKANAPIE